MRESKECGYVSGAFVGVRPQEMSWVPQFGPGVSFFVVGEARVVFGYAMGTRGGASSLVLVSSSFQSFGVQQWNRCARSARAAAIGGCRGRVQRFCHEANARSAKEVTVWMARLGCARCGCGR